MGIIGRLSGAVLREGEQGCPPLQLIFEKKKIMSLFKVYGQSHLYKLKPNQSA